MADRGDPLPETYAIGFEDPDDMFEFLASPLLALLHTIQNHPGTIAALADHLNQDVGSVERNLCELDSVGLVEILDRGDTKEVRAVAQQIKLEILLTESCSAK